jgi:hypothetical protein
MITFGPEENKNSKIPQYHDVHEQYNILSIITYLDAYKKYLHKHEIHLEQKLKLIPR